MSVQFVQMAGITTTLIGELDNNATVLKRPRAVRLTPVPEMPGKVALDFITLLDNPEALTLHTIAYSYRASDVVVKKYMEEVTGLKLAGSGVIHATH